MTPPISIDGTDITGATIDGQDVQEITVDGQTVFSATPDIPDNLLDHRWPMDEGSGSSAADVIGSLDLTLNGATWGSGEGRGGSYLEFDGSNDFAFNDNNSAYNVDTLTIAVWFNANVNNENQTLITFPDTNDFRAAHLLDLRDTGNLRWVIPGGSGTITTSAWSINEWQFTAATAHNANNEVKLYYADVNDTTVTTVGTDSYSPSNRTPSAIGLGALYDDGSNSVFGNFLNGELDNAMGSFGTALSDADVQQIFDATKGDY